MNSRRIIDGRQPATVDIPPSSTAGKALAYLREHGKSMHQLPLSVALGVGVDELDGLLAYPIRQGLIKRSRMGSASLYSAVDAALARPIGSEDATPEPPAPPPTPRRVKASGKPAANTEVPPPAVAPAPPPAVEAPPLHEGWRHWAGGKRPEDLADSSLVEVKLRNGHKMKGRVQHLGWQHDGSSSDILYYRPLHEQTQPAAPRPEPKSAERRPPPGFKPWPGGERPPGVVGSTRVDVMHRDGSLVEDKPAGAITWHHNTGGWRGGDVVAYRIRDTMGEPPADPADALPRIPTFLPPAAQASADLLPGADIDAAHGREAPAKRVEVAYFPDGRAVLMAMGRSVVLSQQERRQLIADLTADMEG